MDELERLLQEEKNKIVSETARVGWQEIERFYAQGVLILVDESLDLVNVAHRISMDEKEQIEQWISTQKLLRDFNEQAKQWADTGADIWCVVVKPWVLVQRCQ